MLCTVGKALVNVPLLIAKPSNKAGDIQNIDKIKKLLEFTSENK